MDYGTLYPNFWHVKITSICLHFGPKTVIFKDTKNYSTVFVINK